MESLVYRCAHESDIPGMAEVRAHDWGDPEFWQVRIRQYLARESHPRDSLEPRTAFVCLDGENVVGLVAGHLTRRFGCDGELQWISVRPEHRSRGIASSLFQHMARWFLENRASKVCVDVSPENLRARRFYGSQGAEDLRPNWMVWRDIGKNVKNPSG